MADFNTNVPLWGNKGTKPSDGLLKDGYAPNDRPTAQNTNFMYNAFSNAIKEVQDNVPLKTDILKKTGDVIEGDILSSPKQLKYSIDKGNATVLGNVNRFSDVSGDSKITITIPKDVVIPGRQTLVFSFLHSFKGGVINLDFSSTYVSDFATTNTDNIKNDVYRKVRLSFTLGESAPYEDIVIVMSAREGNLYSCSIVEDFVTSGLIGVPYSLKAGSLIALHEGSMLPKETRPTLDCNVIRTPYIGYTTNAVNAPQGEKLGTLMVFVTAETSKLTQVFTGNTSGKVYYRTMNIADTFSSWSEVLTGSALAEALSNYTTKEDLKTATAGILTEESATNWQKFKVTQDNGFRVRLKDGTDLLTLATGYYEVAQCKNSPFSETEASWKNIDVIDGNAGRKMLRLTVSARGDTFYKTVHTNSTGGRDWWKVADVSAIQSNKITADDGSSLTLVGYDLLNTTDVANFDGYVIVAVNAPTTSNAGYFKRKYRAGYIEVIFSPHSSKDVYRNSYNANLAVSAWVGWEKIITQSDTGTYQKQKITNDDGTTILFTDYDLLNTTDVKNLDAYIMGAINMPSGVSQSGYFKRKYRGGYIEVTYSPYNLNTVYRNSYNTATKIWTGWESLVTASELEALGREVTTSKPVTLWSGSANGVSSTPYALSRAINTSRKIRVTYDFMGATGKTAVVDLSNTKTLTIHDFNLTDSDANGGGLYEFQLDFTALNRFTIKADTIKDLNGTGKIDQKNMTVRKVEEVD